MRLNLVNCSKRIFASCAELVEREVTVQAPWGKIAALTWGEASNKPVIMCHGKLDSAAVYRPLVQMLPKDYFYIGIDFPGNGRSEHLPKGVPVSIMDFVPSVKIIADHFGADKFTYFGHSLGSQVGQYLYVAYPSRVAAMLELDPIPAYLPCEPDWREWYRYYYGAYYTPGAYDKYNAPADTAPKYTRDKALHLVKVNRGLTDEAAAIAVERTLQPAGDGLYRFTFDQRMKFVVRPPLTSRQLEQIYTRRSMPILCILAEESLKWYGEAPFVLDESKYTGGNYKCVTVPGNHDVHLTHPERLAGMVTEFLRGTS